MVPWLEHVRAFLSTRAREKAGEGWFQLSRNMFVFSTAACISDNWRSSQHGVDLRQHVFSTSVLRASFCGAEVITTTVAVKLVNLSVSSGKREFQVASAVEVLVYH